MIQIDSQFDSGNITLLGTADNEQITLQINTDQNSDFLQWFHFSASGLRGKTSHFSIVNAGKCTYPQGWVDYDVAMSTDRRLWSRTASMYDGRQLQWAYHGDCDRVWFAYFAPYSLEQHTQLVAWCSARPGVFYQSLGNTALGRTIDYLNIGHVQPGLVNKADVPNGTEATTDKKQLWVIARQHPGESMAQWWVQGFLERLLDADDATSVALRSLADIHVVPNMNPDGSYLGHLRTNSLGVNLNREWADPCAQTSPEVFYVRERMQRTGIDLALDAHGDEALPYNFIAGTEGISEWSESRDRQLVAVKHTWACINPDFQYRHGYPRNPPGKANPGICSNHLASSFDCLAMTLEMPFKDTADTPRKGQGWCPLRSQHLGASFVDIAYLTLTDNLIEPDI